MLSYFKYCLVLLLLIAYSCTTKNKEQNFLYFTGRIANADMDSIYLLLNNREKAFALDFDGNFSDTVQLSNEGYKVLSVDRNEYTVYLVPQDSLVLTMDLKNIDSSFYFEGKGYKRNNYLIKKYLETEDFLADNSNLLQLKPDNYRLKIDILHKRLLSALENSEANSLFIEKEKKNLKYDYINLLYSYKDSYSYLHPTSKQLPVNFISDLNGVDLDNDEDYITYQSYRGLVLYSLQEKLYEGYSPEYLLENIKSETIKKGFLKSLIYELEPNDPNSIAIYKVIEKHCTYKPWLEEARKRMNVKE